MTYNLDDPEERLRDATAEEEAARRYFNRHGGTLDDKTRAERAAFLAGSSFAHDRLAAERKEIVRVLNKVLPFLAAYSVSHPSSEADIISSQVFELLARLRSGREGAESFACFSLGKE